MLKRTYKSIYEKIEPPDNLIALTKEKMKQEKAKKHFSFYKYGAIAACFIIAIVITIPYTKTNNSISQSVNSATDSLSGFAPSYEAEGSIGSPSFSVPNNFKGNSFVADSAMSGSINSAKAESIGEKIFNFVKEVLSLPVKLIKSIIEFLTF